jgi:hypothetical protein
MNTQLLNAIHRYAEDREIDYKAAQYIGEQFGKRFASQEELIEWKQLIDRYLKAFETKDFEAIELALNLNEKKGKKAEDEEDEDEEDEDEEDEDEDEDEEDEDDDWDEDEDEEEDEEEEEEEEEEEPKDKKKKSKVEEQVMGADSIPVAKFGKKKSFHAGIPVAKFGKKKTDMNSKLHASIPVAEY